MKVEGVYKSYAKGWFRKTQYPVLRDVSFEWHRGECLGLIGESGSGKSTLGRLLLGIEKPDAGRIAFDGRSVTDRSVRKGTTISAVFQDYTSSINPFYTVRQAILEPIKISRQTPLPSDDDIVKLLVQVGLDESYLFKYPHEMSGGEVQRVCIARAVSTKPSCILLDEAVSSLDCSVQMQVLKLLKDLKDKIGLGYIFITHDIGAAAYLCDRIMIMKGGSLEEIVETKHLKDVQSSYTKELLQKIII